MIMSGRRLMAKSVRWLLAAMLATGFLSSMSRTEDTSLSFQTGNDLYSACTDANPTNGLACLAYLEGALAAFSVTQWIVNAGDTTIMANARRMACIPNGLANGQARDVVIKYMDDNPAQRQVPAAHAVLAALH